MQILNFYVYRGHTIPASICVREQAQQAWLAFSELHAFSVELANIEFQVRDDYLQISTASNQNTYLRFYEGRAVQLAPRCGNLIAELVFVYFTTLT